MFGAMTQGVAMKNVRSIHRGDEAHWVGDGFPVHTVFSYQDLGAELTPFLLLDHAGPADFGPTGEERGVGWHPHRGFETVTIAYQGEVDHEDSGGNRGSIRPGDVQWMTAGSGVLHKEMHGRDYARRGGPFEKGKVSVNGEAASEGELVVFEREGGEATIEAASDATVFVMNGQPIDEPIAGYGPFVMNTQEQIRQAVADYQSGRLGRIPSTTH